MRGFLKVNNSIVIEMSDLEIGGIQQVDVDLANFFSSQGYKVFILVPKVGSTQKNRFSNQISIIYVPKQIHLRMFFLSFFFIRHKITYYFSLYNKLRLIAVIFKIPCIIHIIHNCYRYSVKEKFIERFLKKHTNFVAVSKATQSHAIKNLQLPAKQVSVIYNGVDINAFSPPSQKKDFSKIRICSVGRLVPQKGFDTFIEIASHFTDNTVPVEFALIGDGPEMDNLKTMAKRCDPGENVIRFYGSRMDIASLLHNFHLFISTIRYGGFEIVLAEAMATAMPVIAFDRGPLKEVIYSNEGDAGIVIQNNSVEDFVVTIKNLIANPKEIIRRGDNCRKRVESLFDINNTLSQYKALLYKLSIKNGTQP